MNNNSVLDAAPEPVPESAAIGAEAKMHTSRIRAVLFAVVVLAVVGTVASFALHTSRAKETTVTASNDVAEHYVLDDPTFVAMKRHEYYWYKLRRGETSIDVLVFEPERKDIDEMERDPLGGLSSRDDDGTGSCPDEGWDWVTSWTNGELGFYSSGCGELADAERTELLEGIRVADKRIVTISLPNTFSLEEVRLEDTTYTSESELVEVKSQFGSVRPHYMVDDDPWPREVRPPNGLTVAENNTPFYVDGNRAVHVTGELPPDRLLELSKSVRLSNATEWNQVVKEASDPNRPFWLTSAIVNATTGTITAIAWPNDQGKCLRITLQVSQKAPGSGPTFLEDCIPPSKKFIQRARVFYVHGNPYLFASFLTKPSKVSVRDSSGGRLDVFGPDDNLGLGEHPAIISDVLQPVTADLAHPGPFTLEVTHDVNGKTVTDTEPVIGS